MPRLMRPVIVGVAVACGLLIGSACGPGEPATATDVALRVEPSEVGLVLRVDDHAAGEVELSGEGSYDGSSARLEIDGTKAPNSAGFYGHFDSYEAVYDGEAAYFTVDPTLLAALVEGSGPLSASGTEEIAGEEYWRFSVAPRPGDGTMRALDELFGITEVPMTVVADEDGIVRIIRVEMTYQRVRDTSATTTFQATLTFEPNEDVPSIEPPPGADVEDLGGD